MDFIPAITKIFTEAIKVGGPSVVTTLIWQFIILAAIISITIVVKKVIDKMKKDDIQTKIDNIYSAIIKLGADYKVHTGRITTMVSEALRNTKGLLKPEHVHIIIEVLFAAYRADLMQVVEVVIANIGIKPLTPDIKKQNEEYMKSRFSAILKATDIQVFTLPDIGTALVGTETKLDYLEQNNIYQDILSIIESNSRDIRKARDKISEKLADFMTNTWKLRH